MEVPKSHPRYESLTQRGKIEEGVKEGYVALVGMVAHGRGECFDYLMGEKTTNTAEKAERVAAAVLLKAKNPVISINGNVAALCAREVVYLAKSLNAKIEVNLFYWDEEREKRMDAILRKNGADEVYGTNEEFKVKVPNLDSKRGRVDERGIYNADVVLVPLEDGDRTETLVAMGKTVVAIDLNPLSRTAQKASLSVIDNVTRAIPNIRKFSDELDKGEIDYVIEDFNNKKNLKESINEMKNNLDRLSL